MSRLKKKKASPEKSEASDIADLFPFHVYFSNAPKPLFKGFITKMALLNGVYFKITVTGVCFR